MAETINELDVENIDVEEIIPRNAEAVAEQKKESGNQLYKLKQYRQAISLYTEAIDLCPDIPSYYGNRAACHMMLNRYREALDDSRKAIALDSNFVKGYLRIVKCSISLGDLVTAEQAILKIKEIEPNNTAVISEMNNIETLNRFELEANTAYDKKDYRRVVYCMDRCLDVSAGCPRYKLIKAECLAFLKRYQEAQEIANDILHIDKSNADAVYVRGICLFYEDNIDMAFSHFTHVLKLAPDHKKAMDIYKRAKQLKQKKLEGNAAFKANKFQEAYTLYTEALAIDPLNVKTNAKLYFNRATVLSKMNRLQEAIADCTAALELDDKYLKALLRRAKCYSDISDYDEAVRDYEKACKIDKSRENKRLLQEAKLSLKKSKRKDYYKILGVEKSATEDEIKKAYRKRALAHHPDRHVNASEAEKKEQEKMFKELGEAYGVLIDPKKKSRYDSGQDMDEAGWGEASEIDPFQVFQSFYGGNSGHGAEFSFSSGFPGGFTFQFG